MQSLMAVLKPSAATCSAEQNYQFKWVGGCWCLQESVDVDFDIRNIFGATFPCYT